MIWGGRSSVNDKKVLSKTVSQYSNGTEAWYMEANPSSTRYLYFLSTNSFCSGVYGQEI
jgi:hypothetical protein